MAKKKPGYTPRKISLPSIQRSGKNLARIEDPKNLTVAYCWFGKNDSDISGIAPNAHYFVFDLCNKKNKTISIYLDIDQMHDVVEECRHLSSLSLCRLAQKVVLEDIKETDPRYRICAIALGGMNIDSISEELRSGSFAEDISFLVSQIISCAGVASSDDEIAWAETVLSQYIESLYQAEIDIKSGRHFLPITFIDYYSDTTISEPGTNIRRWPHHKLRVGYKPFVDGTRNLHSWQLLAQTEYIRSIEERIMDDDGNQICVEPIHIGNVSDPEITVAVTNKDFLKLLDQIEYRVKHSES